MMNVYVREVVVFVDCIFMRVLQRVLFLPHPLVREPCSLSETTIFNRRFTRGEVTVNWST